MQVSLDEIEATAKAALVLHGAEDWIAGEVAAAVREAEGLGNRICGLYYLESYCRQLQTGRVKGDAVPEVRRPRPGVVEVDAKFGFAQAAFARALPEAVRAAREMGTISLAVCHAHTCTSLGYFTAQFARAGFIVLGMTNATPVVAPPGGKSRVIGTNPISFAVPDGKGGVAMLFDQSTTTVALGKITMAKAAGEPIPEGWAVDAEGRPTTDPEAALKGSLVSMGGYKGWGFGLMAELLAAGMTGSRAGVDLGPLKAPEGDPHDIGDFYLIMDPDVSGGAFFDRVRQVSEAVQRDEGARMPGQARAVSDPVTVDPNAWALAQRLAGAD
ncbi:Ldh family oxidoreductase [Roseovarius atlanticus]|uniref:Ldh family oxidoreductase n=1 Tax=Roseovarius atlanticus TaxID=1641875 RepID=UPI001C97FCC1|nr:Ldh family oxidoreductase [Roseovarius atlanticus]MBY5988138.1 Ldh family oxidoreductase [Roseovarius atlanticus]MBY6123529.1 Ldh family oxidoreductase [Roseovarius atlanticus]MBY6148024.1 Ldh family oxidoreductase [Roseovarius atlanticus]